MKKEEIHNSGNNYIGRKINIGFIYRKYGISAFGNVLEVKKRTSKAILGIVDIGTMDDPIIKEDWFPISTIV